ncbi:MAG: HEAT repeat domain-containing protein, partial [Ignavibacteria bacterium]
MLTRVIEMMFCVLLLFTSFHLYSQPFSKDAKEILKIGDLRDYSRGKELIKYFEKNDYRSFLAAANLEDTNLINNLGELLLSGSDKYDLIPWVLGQMNNHSGVEYLLKTLEASKNPKNKLEIIKSLGKIGDQETFEKVLQFMPVDRNEEASSLSIARFGMRKIKSADSFRKLEEILKTAAVEIVKKNIAYAFNRIGDKESLSPYKSVLTDLSSISNPYTRMWAFSALGKLQDTANINYLIESLDNEEDWRVRVNLCFALRSVLPDLNSPLIDKLTGVLLRHATEDASTHVSIAALQSLGKLFNGLDTRNPIAKKIQQDIQFLLTANKAIDWQIKAEAIRTYVMIFKDDVKNELLGLFSQTENYDLKAAIVGSFGTFNDVMVYKELRDSISADVQRYNIKNPNKDGSMIGSPELAKLYLAFVDALTQLDDKMDEDNKNNIRLILSEFSASRNPAITDMCLTNLQDSIYMQYRNETCQIMVFDYNGFKFPADKDVMLMYIEAWNKMKYGEAKNLLIKNLKHPDYDIAKASADVLKNITDKDYEKGITAEKYRTDFDWDFIDKLQEKKFATIKTNQGYIKVVLYPNECPFTVQNFVKLGEKGYYNNT